ncbi:hypothetical protein ACIRPH_02150 [Nocardiopsis sp. NPDC101807]|uniref:hypothetical protein n=1 Tax=Nocardiopsis sp. NPDC101807 TaxID=3364339 RepID=UPI00380A9706
MHAAYAALALTDPDLAAQPHASGPDELLPELSGLLEEARRGGRFPPGREVRSVAIGLLALATGLSAYVVSGFQGSEEAEAELRGRLDEVFGRTAPVAGEPAAPEA